MAQILVIDDTKNIRKMVELTLRAQGHEITLAENGALGLEEFGDGTRFDLTLVDQQMPEMSGDAFILEAHQLNPTARIVMMTAFATPELASTVMQTGALDFLRKPFTTEVLRDVVSVALERSRTADSSHTDPSQKLSRPGEEGYKMPQTSWSMNGFTFWPAEQSQKDAGIAHEHPAQFESGRMYQLRVPSGDYIGCFVGVTPHVQAQIESEVGHPIGPDDAFWDALCGQTLMNYLAENSRQPPQRAGGFRGATIGARAQQRHLVVERVLPQSGLVVLILFSRRDTDLSCLKRRNCHHVEASSTF